MNKLTTDLPDDYRKILPAKLLQYHDHITELLEVNDINILDKAKQASYIHHGVLTKYYAECAILDLLRKKRSKLIEEMKNSFNVNEHFSSISPNNPKPSFQLIKDIENSPDVHQFDVKISEQIMITNYLKDSLEIFSKHGYTLTTAKDLLKMEV